VAIQASDSVVAMPGLGHGSTFNVQGAYERRHQEQASAPDMRGQAVESVGPRVSIRDKCGIA